MRYIKIRLARLLFEILERLLGIASRALARQLVPHGNAILVCGAATSVDHAPEMFARYSSLATQLGYWLATTREGWYSLVTGGCPGIIATVQHSFCEKRLRPQHQRSLGIRVELGFRQEPNEHSDWLGYPRRFGPRKELMADCVAMGCPGIIIVFPGGPGTLDELAHILCLAVRTGRPLRVILVDIDWWKPLLKQFQKMVELGVMGAPTTPIHHALHPVPARLEAITAVIERYRGE